MCSLGNSILHLGKTNPWGITFSNLGENNSWELLSYLIPLGNGIPHWRITLENSLGKVFLGNNIPLRILHLENSRGKFPWYKANDLYCRCFTAIGNAVILFEIVLLASARHCQTKLARRLAFLSRVLDNMFT